MASVTENNISPCLNDGLNPNWIVSPACDVKEWLAHRLEGCDPYFPRCSGISEEYDTLIVGLLLEVGHNHTAFKKVAKSILHLLEEAKVTVQVPAYFVPLLRICKQVSMPITREWFEREIQQLANNIEFYEEDWGASVAHEIVFAALTQMHPKQSRLTIDNWRRLLGDSRYETLAFLALQEKDRVPYEAPDNPKAQNKPKAQVPRKPRTTKQQPEQSTGDSFFISDTQIYQGYSGAVVERRDDCTRYEQCLFEFQGVREAYCPASCAHFVKLHRKVEDFMINRNTWDSIVW
jgi:hypothetical protein